MMNAITTLTSVHWIYGKTTGGFEAASDLLSKIAQCIYDYLIFPIASCVYNIGNWLFTMITSEEFRYDLVKDLIKDSIKDFLRDSIKAALI